MEKPGWCAPMVSHTIIPGWILWDLFAFSETASRRKVQLVELPHGLSNHRQHSQLAPHGRPSSWRGTFAYHLVEASAAVAARTPRGPKQMIVVYRVPTDWGWNIPTRLEEPKASDHIFGRPKAKEGHERNLEIDPPKARARPWFSLISAWGWYLTNHEEPTTPHGANRVTHPCPATHHEGSLFHSSPTRPPASPAMAPLWRGAVASLPLALVAEVPDEGEGPASWAVEGGRSGVCQEAEVAGTCEKKGCEKDMEWERGFSEHLLNSSPTKSSEHGVQRRLSRVKENFLLIRFL